jgi:dihydroorotate dehydrogenase
LVKLSPDLTDAELNEAVETILAAGVEGIIATNTTTSRDGVQSPLAREAGGLSGAALTARSTEIVRRIHELTGGRLPIIACGGVMNAADARAKLDAGACMVQIYTGLVYEGPAIVRRIVEAL